MYKLNCGCERVWVCACVRASVHACVCVREGPRYCSECALTTAALEESFPKGFWIQCWGS